MKVLVFPNRSSNNPYFEEFNSSLRIAGMQNIRVASVLSFRSQFDLMHFHFPDHVITQGNLFKSFVITLSVLCLTSYARATRRPIVWMVHDVTPLWVRRARALSMFMKLFKSYVDGYVFLSESSQKEFYKNNPKERAKPSTLVHISRYKDYTFDAAAIERLRAQNQVGKGEILVSILGDIKPHKGFQCIPLIPSHTRDGVKVNLAICGRVDGMKEAAIEQVLQDRPHGHYVRVEKRLEDDELALWIQSSDAVLLPYRIGSNSGMAINVLSNHGRVIASDIAMFRELVSRFGESWIKTVDFADRSRIEHVIDAIPAWTAQPPDTERWDNALREGDPEQTGKRLFAFYSELCALTKEVPGYSRTHSRSS